MLVREVGEMTLWGLAFRKLNGFLTMSDMRKILSGQRRDAGRYVK